ncbi:MAG: nitroreductase family protein [Actinomycetota bacterium]|nr:nitroreductase family protein [Actinomycetota bacterium]
MSTDNHQPGREPRFFDVALAQRAVREFSDRPVTDQQVEACLQAATHAPSAENRQPWIFVVVRDASLRGALAELTRRAWLDGAREHSVGRLPERLLDEVDRGARSGIGTAPVIVVACGDTGLGLEQTLAASVYPAVQNVLLAAGALGLGSAMTTLATRYPDELRHLLGLPPTARPMAVVPIGWPKRPPGPPRRLPLADRVHRDQYGHPW